MIFKPSSTKIQIIINSWNKLRTVQISFLIRKNRYSRNIVKCHQDRKKIPWAITLMRSWIKPMRKPKREDKQCRNRSSYTKQEPRGIRTANKYHITLIVVRRARLCCQPHQSTAAQFILLKTWTDQTSKKTWTFGWSYQSPRSWIIWTTVINRFKRLNLSSLICT